MNVSKISINSKKTDQLRSSLEASLKSKPSIEVYDQLREVEHQSFKKIPETFNLNKPTTDK
jgi:hypothetical protein